MYNAKYFNAVSEKWNIDHLVLSVITCFQNAVSRAYPTLMEKLYYWTTKTNFI